jgi:hypothetical protein
MVLMILFDSDFCQIIKHKDLGCLVRSVGESDLGEYTIYDQSHISNLTPIEGGLYLKKIPKQGPAASLPPLAKLA